MSGRYQRLVRPATCGHDGAVARHRPAAAIVAVLLGLAAVGAPDRDARAECPKVSPGVAEAAASFARGVAHARAEPPALAEARRELTRAVALDPTHAGAHYELAEVLLRAHASPGYERTAAELYTRAIQNRPDLVPAYLALADLYRRLGFAEQARAVLHAALRQKPSEKERFVLLAHLAQVEEDRGELVASLARFEEAKKACGACTEPEEVVVYYDLGVAYATLQPPRASEAIAQLTAFQKLACKGNLASRYAEACTIASDTVTRLQQRRVP